MLEFDSIKNAFKDKYTNPQLIGTGTFSKVFKCNTKNNEFVAIKIVDLERIQNEIIPYMKNEIVLLSTNQNNNIVQLIEAAQYQQTLLLVLEYCCIDAQSMLIKWFKRTIPEDLVIIIFRQLVNGLHSLHKNKIIHRDIKLANLGVKLTTEEEQRLIQNNDLSVFYNAQYKLLDFGLAKQLTNEELTNTYAGTEQTMAPEIILELPYSISADMYSLGVIIFQLITGQLPYKMVKGCLEVVKYEMANFQLIQREALRTVVQKMLKFDPKERMTWSELYQKEFFQNKSGQTQSILDLQLKSNQDIYSEIQCEDNQFKQDIFFDCQNNEQIDKYQLKLLPNQENKNIASYVCKNLINQEQRNKIQYWNKLRNICILLNKLSSNTTMLMNTINYMANELLYYSLNSEFKSYINYLCDLNQKTYDYLKKDTNNHFSEYIQFEEYVTLKKNIETDIEFKIIQKNKQTQQELISDLFFFASQYLYQLKPLDLREFDFGQEGFYEQTTNNNILIYNQILEIIYNSHGRMSEHNSQNFKLIQGQIYRILIDLARVRAMFGADWKWRDEKINELRLEDFAKEPDLLPQYLTEILQFYQLRYQ
ncbi:unnamed protein product [Paramecium octaurelia]|uniref:Protein kinase domain-containing protein n=1 Tax=Paramecium octaurelia TaxID=43137 RepID=A0A8S1UBB0_PAROT|nr:unnamed protein product [Paramecium octaurelia]